MQFFKLGFFIHNYANIESPLFFLGWHLKLLSQRQCEMYSMIAKYCS